MADDETADVDGDGQTADVGGDGQTADVGGDGQTPDVGGDGRTADGPSLGEDGRSRRQAPASRLQPEQEATRTALSPKVEAWRKRSATGAILTGFAFGLREALEPERKEPAIVMETSGDPPGDLPVEADLEDHRPRRSVVNIRPWLLSPDARSDSAGDHQSPAGASDETPIDPDDPAGGDPANN